MHAKIATVLLIIVMQAGCSSVNTIVRSTQGHLNQWVNHPVNHLLEQQGLPHTVIRMDNKRVAHIKHETWDSEFGTFMESDISETEQWNDQISSWILIYRHEEERLDGNYYACTQSYHVNYRGVIIKVKEGWTSPDNQNPCYIKFNKQDKEILIAKF